MPTTQTNQRQQVNTYQTLTKKLAKFGTVGILAFITDIGLFNLLNETIDKPLTAKIISVTCATIVAFIGNRQWTFKHAEKHHPMKEYALFFILNAIAMAISVTCLAISHYALNLTSPLADNISANIIGIGLGTIFRYWSYQKWVFKTPKQPKPTTI